MLLRLLFAEDLTLRSLPHLLLLFQNQLNFFFLLSLIRLIFLKLLECSLFLLSLSLHLLHLKRVWAHLFFVFLGQRKGMKNGIRIFVFQASVWEGLHEGEVWGILAGLLAHVAHEVRRRDVERLVQHGLPSFSGEAAC